jgi:hypothetical protein
MEPVLFAFLGVVLVFFFVTQIALIVAAFFGGRPDAPDVSDTDWPDRAA